MKWFNKCKSLLVVALSAILIFGSSIHPVSAKDDTGKNNLSPVTIQAVQMKGDEKSPELAIATSTPATYTSYKTTSPHRLVVDFSQAIPLDSLSNIQFDKGPVKSVTLKRFDTDAGVLTRMEVYLTQNIEPVITPSTEKNGELRISFPGFKAEHQVETAKQDAITPVQPVQPEQSTTQPENDVPKDVPAGVVSESIQAVITDIVARDGNIAVLSQNPVKEYKTFRLNKPERVVVDIPGAKSTMITKLVQLNVAGVSTARIGNYPDKVRIVFDSSSTSLPDATIENTSSGLNIVFTSTSKEPTQAVATPSTDKPRPVAADSQTVMVAKPKSEQHGAHVAAIDFQVLDAVSRVTLKLTGSPVIDEPVKVAGSVSFRVKNTQLPRNLQRSLEAREFVTPVLRVTPVQVKTKNSTDVLVRISLKTDASFELRRETDVVYLDIKHPAVVAKPVEQTKALTAQKASAAGAVTPIAEDQLTRVSDSSPAAGKTKYSGRKVTLEFADAEVRKIFQLLSEVSNKNFVLGDEVAGTISLKLVNVPWDQALDIIMDTKGLDKREEGNIVLIRGKGKFKSILDEEMEVRMATLKSEPLDARIFEVNYADLGGIVTQFNALKTERGVITSDTRTNKVIVKDVKSALNDMGKILKDLDVPEKQVMIEARIIEASSDFSRSLGVSWGLKTDPAAGGQNWPFINNFSSVFGGIASVPGTSTIGSTAGAADITFGTIGSNVKLSMRLNAAAKAGLIRIISSPKVATLNNKSAKITQGKQIPYISSTSDKVETKFVEAALSLEVTPHINNNGTIVLKIDAKNDAPDTTSTSTTPPINKKQATTEMLLKDGETTVIGGIFVDTESEGEEGIPWLKDVPILGNIFKSTTYSKNKSELLIFITPRILNTVL